MCELSHVAMDPKIQRVNLPRYETEMGEAASEMTRPCIVGMFFDILPKYLERRLDFSSRSQASIDCELRSSSDERQGFAFNFCIVLACRKFESFPIITS